MAPARRSQEAARGGRSLLLWGNRPAAVAPAHAWAHAQERRRCRRASASWLGGFRPQGRDRPTRGEQRGSGTVPGAATRPAFPAASEHLVDGQSHRHKGTQAAEVDPAQKGDERPIAERLILTTCRDGGPLARRLGVGLRLHGWDLLSIGGPPATTEEAASSAVQLLSPKGHHWALFGPICARKVLHPRAASVLPIGAFSLPS